MGTSKKEGQRVKPRTLGRKALLREYNRRRRRGEEDPELLELMERIEKVRPRTRADCRDGIRPCPFILCRYNLYIDVNPRTGSIKFNFPGKDLWELEETCALDVAERGAITLEEVGRIMNLTRERVRQIEQDALNKIREYVEEIKEVDQSDE